jgi:hypothetical protein
MKLTSSTLFVAAAVLVAVAASPASAKKAKAAKAPDAASQVVDTTKPEETSAPSEAKRDPLPPINADDTAFAPSKGKPERGGQGKLEIVTRPSGAEVYYADEYRGKSPIVIDASSGRDDLSIDLDGWNLYKSRVNVWPNQTTTLNIELKLPLGNLKITTTPPKAQITLDGRPIGSTNGAELNVGKVPAGKHALCGNGGGRSGCQQIEVPREDVLKIQLNLK